MKKILLYILITIVLLVLGFFLLNDYIYKEKQADFKPGDTVAVSGSILAVDLEKVALDGPVLITLSTAESNLKTIEVPSMGILLCPASPNIADVFALKTGEIIEVNGEVLENGSIVPCQSEDHYLRLVQEI